MSSFPLNDMEVFFQSAERFFEFFTHQAKKRSNKKEFWENKINLSEYLALLRQDALLKSVLAENTTIASVPSPPLPPPITAWSGSSMDKTLGERQDRTHRILGNQVNMRKHTKNGLVFQGKEEEVSHTHNDASLQHITQHMLSAVTRRKYMNELRSDEVFAPLLDLITGILQYNGDSDSSCR
jgi:hypothetical protein